MSNPKKLATPIFALLITTMLLTSAAFAAEAEGGIGSILSGIIEQVTSWLRTSPLSSLVSPKTPTKAVHVLLYPETFTLSPDSPVNIETNNITFENFGGDINTSYSGKTIVLGEANSNLKITIPLSHVKIADVKVKLLEARNMKIEIRPNMTAENSAVELHTFSGTCDITPEYMEFLGEVSLLKAEIGGLEWELK